MSHFTVLVIGDNVEKQLAPFHEFECTGRDDEYVQDIDKTDDERANFEESTVRKVRLADGTVIGRYDDACYRDPTTEELKKIGPISGFGVCHGMSYDTKDWGDGRGYRAKVWHLPEGAEELEERHSSFADYLRWSHDDSFIVPHGEKPDIDDDHKYGYALQDENGEITKVIDRTNPNAKWDWYLVGGRWAGFFKLKPGATGHRGKNGVMGSCKSEGGADQVRKGDIDIAGMRAEAATKAGEEYDKVHAVIAGREWIAWDDCRQINEGDIEAARAQYNGQPVVQDVRKLAAFLELDAFKVSREDYTKSAADRVIRTFAVLKDGQWYERGEMGWWGSVSEEKDDWQAQFSELIDGLPDDALLTVVDCHI